ncbi:hypothetical protein [Bradyrhizobium australiense]|uniref:Uncharacterized protein n=1 Tax=Bradyrhizobium australiense TaxID=2721161 RepID=A0A7Y4H046_9BRAD|nr:hypothetical protein [Bradyrhizobium australiense]
MLHRARHLFIRQQTAVINSIRAYLAEFGIVALSGAGVSSNCWKSSPIQPMTDCPRSPARVLLVSAVNCVH